MPRFRVLLGDRVVRARGLTYSNVDPGGFEAASFAVAPGERPSKGDKVRIYSDNVLAWEGRVGELQPAWDGRRLTLTVGCEGFGAQLKAGGFAEVYVNSDLNAWQAASTQRRIDHSNNGRTDVDHRVAADPVGGEPSLVTAFLGAWTNNGSPISQAQYRSELALASIYYAWKRGPNTLSSDVNMHWSAVLADDADTDVNEDITSELRAAGPGSGTLVATTGGRTVATVQHYFTAATAGGAASVEYSIFWTCLAVYGQHGLTKRGIASATEAQGFYPSDIVRDVVKRCSGIAPGAIRDATGIMLTQLVEQTPILFEAWLEKMRAVTGWGWQVWEGGSPDALPALDFMPPPTEATVLVRYTDCQGVSLSSQLASLYDRAEVTYRDQAGMTRTTVVMIDNPELAEAGVSRTMFLDAGQTSVELARVFGAFILQLGLSSQRAVGSIVLPSDVRTPGGGSRAAHLVRAGRDRLKLLDVPLDAGALGDERNAYHARRVSVAVSDRGQPTTTVEVDNGADLVEVLNARLAARGL